MFLAYFNKNPQISPVNCYNRDNSSIADQKTKQTCLPPLFHSGNRHFFTCQNYLNAQMPFARFSPEYSLAELENSLSAHDVRCGESKSKVQHTIFKNENVHTSAIRNGGIEYFSSPCRWWKVLHIADEQGEHWTLKILTNWTLMRLSVYADCVNRYLFVNTLKQLYKVWVYPLLVPKWTKHEYFFESFLTNVEVY